MDMDSTDYTNCLIDKARMELWIRVYMENRFDNKTTRKEYLNSALAEFDDKFKKGDSGSYGPM